MISRRVFLAALPAGFVTASAPLTTQTPSGNVSGVKIGCQTNAWRINPADFSQLLGVLAKLKDLGFEGFETGFRNVQDQFANPKPAREQIEKTGLRLFGVHILLDQYDMQTQIAPFDLIRKVADGAASLGAQYLILSGGGLNKYSRVDIESLKRKVGGLNEAGKYSKSKGVKLAYHNHDVEVADKGLEIEGLFRLTDPTVVDFLIDCGSAYRVKMNVPQFFARYHTRIIGLHLRDFKNYEQVTLGQGDFPLNDLAAEIKRLNWTGWVLNEEERLSGEKPGDKAVGPARQALRQAFGK